MKKEVKKKIKKWLNYEILNKEEDQYSHWHIDNFDSKASKNISDWINIGIQMLSFASTELEQSEKTYYVYLAIFLEPKKKSQNIELDQFSDIIKELHSSPPALYLFDKKQENLFFSKVRCKRIVLSQIKGVKNNFDCFYTEYFDGEECFYSLWIKVKNKNL